MPTKSNGKLYILLTIITCLTSFPVMKTGHFTGAHGLGVIVLVLLPIGVYVKSLKPLGKFADYIQIIVLSLTLFLSCIPAVVETLTRLPISHPVATGPADQIVQTCLSALALIFLGGVIYHFIKLKSIRKSTTTPGCEIKFN